VGEESWETLYPVQEDWAQDRTTVSDFDPTQVLDQDFATEVSKPVVNIYQKLRLSRISPSPELRIDTGFLTRPIVQIKVQFYSNPQKYLIGLVWWA